MIELHLPYPPTVGNYWGQRGKSRFIKQRGLDFRSAVSYEWLRSNRKPASGRLKVQIALYPPDNRKRDVDNICKASLDALEHAGVFEDDEQIDDLRIVRMDKVEDGACIVMIEEIQQ